MNSWFDWPDNRIKGDVKGEATRETPAQTASPYLRRGFAPHPDLQYDPT